MIILYPSGDIRGETKDLRRGDLTAGETLYCINFVFGLC